jgi:micrococcal nuclease
MLPRFTAAAIAFAFAWALLVAKVAYAQRPDLEGKVIRVIDGDTLDILVDGKQRRVRLEGIDSPESTQPFYHEARQALSDKVLDKQASVKVTGRHFERLVDVVTVGGMDVNRVQVAAGLAWHFAELNKDTELAAAEQKARATNAGLWRDDLPLAPWLKRAEANDKPATVATVYVANTGSKYHLNTCRHLRAGYCEPCKTCRPGR